MDKVKVLFLIHDLGQGGAEKVLVNLVNNMDQEIFDISVTALFGGGVNEKFLKPEIHYHTVFKRMIRGNSLWMKLFSSKQLHKFCVKETYDIEVSYLEGPSARVISGCQDEKCKLVSWIHSDQKTIQSLSKSFRSPREATDCYNQFDRTICVSRDIKNDFCNALGYKKPCVVLYNTVESETILKKAEEPADKILEDGKVKLIAVGSLKEVKGFDRLLRIINRLTKEGKKVHLYILGKGQLQEELQKYIVDNQMEDSATLLGYDTNPYKYIKKCDLFVCASYSEGFSTAATEALIVGTAVCTVDVSGMKEMLGEHNEYGVVIENNEEALYQGIKQLMDNSELLAYYKKQAEIRGKAFNTEKAVKAVEEMLLSL